MGSSLIKWIGIIAAIIVVDLVAGYFIGTKVLIPFVYKTEDKAETKENKKDEVKKGENIKGPGLYLELESINLNPAKSNGEIFSCMITLEAPGQGVIDELTSRLPQVRDIILTYLSFKTVQDLNDPANREIYRKELIEKINAILTAGKITNLYIPQWILQLP